jgi:acyl-CoA thioester hydrolase
LAGFKLRINTTLAMIEYEYSFRVGYHETDKMGTVHHSNYAKYYETARWELLRSIGISYKSIEESGFLLPVTRMSFRFLKTIHYDDLLLVRVSFREPKGARIWFSYKLFNMNNELVNEAETELAFVSSKNWQPCAVPEYIMNAIELSLLK